MKGYIKIEDVMTILWRNKEEDMYNQYAYSAHEKDIKAIEKFVKEERAKGEEI